jgi:Transposase DDE domain
MDKRLEKRYQQLVRSHMHTNHELASGIKTQLKNDTAFAQTQAAWRFLNNENCTLIELNKPLLSAAHELCDTECDQYTLVAHDWSHLSYGKHKSKSDTYKTIKNSVGYKLQTSLLLSDNHGGPLSVVGMNLQDKKQIHSSYSNDVKWDFSPLEALLHQIIWLEEQGFKKKLVHIIDREADSVGFLRGLEGKLWLIRGKGQHKANDGKNNRKIQDIAENLNFDEERIIQYKGKKATQQIAETMIWITRPANPRKLSADGKRVKVIPGAPVACRLIVSKIVDSNHKEIGMWYLLTSVRDVSKATVALWYYWRWSIETFYKLMKSAGMQLESWQQTTSLAIAKRIMVASMACVTVWRIANAKGPEASEIKKLLIRLSGRQMKWKKEFTYTALLAGLWSLLSMDDMLETLGAEKIKSLLAKILGEYKFV